MNERKIHVNDMPKGFKLFFLLLPLIGIVLIIVSAKLDNDFYFLYPTGEYIVRHGFPTKDILSMHTDMNIIVQQWLSTVILYFIYSKFGLAGLTVLMIGVYLAVAYLIFRLCYIISNNLFISALFSLLADFLIAAMFIVTRPQLFTFLIVLLELYCLENFVKTASVKWLFPLPFLSVLLINLHASMWLMLFVFALPYAASAIPFKFKKMQQEPSCSFMKLLLAGILCFAAGFLNPYGIKAMLYIFTSFGQSEINGLISEMQPISMGDSTGKLMFGVLTVLMVIALKYKKGQYSLRFVLLFAGTLLLGMMTMKSFAYFFLAGIPAYTYYLRNVNPTLTVTENERTKKDKIKIGVLIALIVGVIVGGIAYTTSPDSNSKEVKEEDKLQFSEMEKAADILDNAEEDIILYAGFNLGNYMEFRGYHPYIDGRAELFLKKNNGDFNYLKEYNQLTYSQLYYKDFTEKYHFNYLVVDQSERELWMNLAHDKDYDILFEGKTLIVFKLKNVVSLN